MADAAHTRTKENPLALGDSYATAAELKTRLSITVATFDTQLGEALAAASRSVEKFCERQFNKTTTASARTYYSSSDRRADVDDFHTVTGLVVKTDEGDDGTFETTWTSGDYQLEPRGGIVGGEPGWPFYRIYAVDSRRFPICGYRVPIEVTAQWGWNAVPASVKEATLIVAEELFKLKDAPYGVAGFTEYGAVRVRRNPYVCHLLDPYRRYAVLVG